MAADNLRAFLAENAIKTEDVTYVASQRFLDESRTPIGWKIRIMTSEECDNILNQCKRKEFIPGTRETKVSTDNEKFVTSLVCASVTYPNLDDADLQNSYDAIGSAALVHKMLTPGEFTDLANAVQQACGYEVGMKDKIQQAKN